MQAPGPAVSGLHLNSFTQQECLGSLQRLELLYFCSMIFGYEALDQGRGREEIGPTSRDLFFSCSEPALFWLSEGFTRLFVKPKPTFSRGARGCDGLRSCCTGGLVSSPHLWLRCSTAVPGASTPLQLHFSPPIFALAPLAFLRRSLKKQVILPLSLPFSLDARSEVQIFRNEVNHLPPSFCKHGPYTCPQIGATAHLLQTSLPLFPECRMMLQAQP